MNKRPPGWPSPLLKAEQNPECAWRVPPWRCDQHSSIPAQRTCINPWAESCPGVNSVVSTDSLRAGLFSSSSLLLLLQLSQFSSAFGLFWAVLMLIFDGRDKTVFRSHKILETSPVLRYHEADDPWPALSIPLIYPIRKQFNSGEGLHINEETFSITYTRTESFLCF